MTGWYILGGIIALLVLIALTPAAAEVKWDEDGFRLFVRVWFLRIRLGDKEPKKEKPGEKKEEEKEPKPAKKLPTLPVMKLLAKHGFDLLGRLVSRVRVRVLRLRIWVALGDPASTALAYGAIGAAMEGVIAAGKSRLKAPDMRVFADLEGDQSAVELHFRAGIRVGQVIGAALRFGAGFLKDYLPLRREMQKKG